MPEPATTPMDKIPGEARPRICQACGESYEYSLADSRATRFHCDNCAVLPEAARKSLTRLARRIRNLERELRALRKNVAGS